MTDDYPYMSYYLPYESIEADSVTVSRSGYKWPSTAGRLMATQHTTYYSNTPNDLGILTQWKSVVVPLHHGVRLDAIPQLVDELSGGSRSVLQEEWEEMRGDVIGDSTTVLSEGFRQEASQIGIDMTWLQSRGTDEDTLFVYIQSQVLQQKVWGGSTPYIPLSVMLSIASQYEKSSAVFDGMEAKVYNCLVNPNEYKIDGDAVYLNNRVYIDRQGVGPLLTKAADLISTVRREKEEEESCIFLDTYTHASNVPDSNDTQSVYVISREVTSEEYMPVPLHNALTSKGFYYRGTLSYVVQQKEELRYPIWFYSVIEVGSAFPPLLPSKPNGEVILHSKSIEWNDEIPSVRVKIVKKSSYADTNGTEDYLGIMRVFPHPIQVTPLDIPREGTECIFFQVLVPHTIGKIKLDVPRQSVSKLMSVGDELRDYTSLTVYTGSPFSKQVLLVTEVGGGWYLYNRYLFSLTASSVPVQVWNRIRSIQDKIKPNELIRMARAEEKTIPLSLGLLWKHWTSIRWISRSTDREVRWIGQGGRTSTSPKKSVNGVYVGTNNTAEKFLLSRNRYGLLQPFHRPIASAASIITGLPLPSVGVPISSYIDMDRDRWYLSYSSHIVVEVEDNSIMVRIGEVREVFMSPLNEILPFSQPDGKYTATLSRTTSDMSWNFTGEARAEDVTASYSDLLQYYSSLYYNVQAEDWYRPPTRSARHIYAEDETVVLTTEEAKSIVVHGVLLLLVTRGDHRGFAEAIARQTLESPSHTILAAYSDVNLEETLAGMPVITWSSATSATPETSVVSYVAPWPSTGTTIEVVDSSHSLIASETGSGVTMKWYRPSEEGSKDVLIVSIPQFSSSVRIRQGTVVLNSVTDEQAEEAVEILQEGNAAELVELPVLLDAPTVENRIQLKRFVLSHILD